MSLEDEEKWRDERGERHEGREKENDDNERSIDFNLNCRLFALSPGISFIDSDWFLCDFKYPFFLFLWCALLFHIKKFSFPFSSLSHQHDFFEKFFFLLFTFFSFFYFYRILWRISKNIQEKYQWERRKKRKKNWGCDLIFTVAISFHLRNTQRKSGKVFIVLCVMDDHY